MLSIILILATLLLQVHNFSVSESHSSGDPKVCDGNRFKYISTYSLGKQTDLNQTFSSMDQTLKVDKVVYKDELFRTYTISNMSVSLKYLDGNQISPPIGFDRVRVSGGYLKIDYKFNWQKKQLSSSIQGYGNGSVRSDSIAFIKSLDINGQTKTFEWKFISAEPIKITNSLTLSDFKPYKAADYDIVNEMLNQLKSGDPTVKSKLIEALNTNFTKILSFIVGENNQTWKEPQKIFYTYTDYHGDFSLTYDNIMLNFSLDRGLNLLLSQTIQNDSSFQCGEKVPTQPQNTTKYGGLQQFISNTFIKYTLKNALNKGFLDIVLSQQFWQSAAFQFYMGDLHEVIPSTKNISYKEPITGRCRALNDKYFDFDTRNKSQSQSELVYLVSVNFTCDLKIFSNTKRLLGIDIGVNYTIGVIPQASSLNVVVQSIIGTPTFYQEDEFKIKNMDLALYMVDQTLKTILGTKVLGSGFKTMSRKDARAEIRSKYLLVYDALAINSQA